MYFLVNKTSETRLLIRSADMTAVHLSHKIIGTSFLPVSNAVCLLGLALRALDVNTSLVAEHQPTLVRALVERRKWVGAETVATTVGK